MQITWENPEVTVKWAYILVGAIMYSLLGCHGSPETAPTTLTADQVDELHIINNAQADALAAARASFPSSAVETKAADPHADKMQKMIKLIQESGKCAQTNQPANETYTASWTSTWQVAGAGCPVGMVESKNFSVDKRTLTLYRAVKLNSDFQEASGLGSVLMQGKLEPGPVMGGKKTVLGHLIYDDLVVVGVGRLSAVIDVTPLDFDRGNITMRLQTPTQTVKAVIRWNLTQTRFRVNDLQDLDEKTFNDLFSSFQLTELLDRVKKMM